MVGYKNSLSKVSGVAFARSKATSISNPKSYAQARQRAKARPAALFYQAFEQILNHAFIPAGKSGQNRNRFMALAMANSVVPGVLKGENLIPVNVPYQLSEGSLGLNGLTRIGLGSGAGADKRAEFVNLAAAAAWDGDVATIRELTIAQFSQLFIAANNLLQDGEELTFVAVLVDVNDLSQRVAAHISIVLNTSDTLTTMGDVMGSMLDLIAVNGHLTLVSGSESLYGIAAAGLIISSKTTKSWIYTNSVLQRTAWAIDGFDYDEDSVIESYMTAAAGDITSDKVLQQADNIVTKGVIAVNLINEGFTATSERATATGVTFSSQQATIAVMSDGTRRVVTNSAGSLCVVSSTDTSSAASVIASVAGGSSFPMTIADTAWSGNQTIPFSEVSGASFRV